MKLRICCASFWCTYMVDMKVDSGSTMRQTLGLCILNLYSIYLHSSNNYMHSVLPLLYFTYHLKMVPPRIVHFACFSGNHYYAYSTFYQKHWSPHWSRLRHPPAEHSAGSAPVSSESVPKLFSCFSIKYSVRQVVLKVFFEKIKTNSRILRILPSVFYQHSQRLFGQTVLELLLIEYGRCLFWMVEVFLGLKGLTECVQWCESIESE